MNDIKYVVLMNGIRNGLYFKKYYGCDNVDDCLAFISLMKRSFEDVEWQDTHVVEASKVYMTEEEFRQGIQ